MLLPDAGYLEYAAGEENILLDLTQLMMILYLKRIYFSFRKFKALERKSKGLCRFAKKDRFKEIIVEFAEICAPIILGSGTLPDSIKDQGTYPLRPLLHELENAGHTDVVRGTGWVGYFEDSSEVAEERSEREKEKRDNPPFKKIYENWMRDASVREETSAH